MNTLLRYNVSYIIFGPTERELGDLDPHTLSYLVEVFATDHVAIYRVDQEAAAAVGQAAARAIPPSKISSLHDSSG